MRSVLITAFDRYDRFEQNASWLCLLELTKDLPTQLDVTTRRYPVDFVVARERLAKDLEANFDVAIHLGQAPGSSRMRLESVAINVAQEPDQGFVPARPLAPDGPVAYRSALPLDAWAALLRGAGIPAAVSYHGGTYLCNALLYWTHFLAERKGYQTRSVFVHLPLDTRQAIQEPREASFLPSGLAAAGMHLLLQQIVLL